MPDLVSRIERHAAKTRMPNLEDLLRQGQERLERLERKERKKRSACGVDWREAGLLFFIGTSAILLVALLAVAAKLFA